MKRNKTQRKTNSYLKFSNQYPTEESFVLYHKKQDKASFERLYQEWGHLVYGTCLKYLKNKEDARDAVTDIFEKLWFEIPKQQVSHWKSWLFAVTKFHCLMQIRAKKAKYQNLTENPWDDADDITYKEPWWAAIDIAVVHLKADQQKCIQRFFWEGLTYEQIAQTEGITLNAVKSHIQNGKRNMRIWIEQNHGKP